MPRPTSSRHPPTSAIYALLGFVALAIGVIRTFSFGDGLLGGGIAHRHRRENGLRRLSAEEEAGPQQAVATELAPPSPPASAQQTAAAARHEVPKILHLVTIWLSQNDPPPPYWAPVIEHTTKIASEQGFETRIWNAEDAEALVKLEQYSHLVPTWEKIRATREGARIADFVRLLAVHRHGGVYLDVDMVPCSGLTELTSSATMPGVASFPFTQSFGRLHGQVSNGAFAAPPGHRVLSLAIGLIHGNPDCDTGPVLHTTGPPVLAHAVQLYNEEKGLDLPNVYEKEPIPGGTFRWTQGGDVRLGTFTYEGRRDPSGKLNLWHLAFASWMPDKFRDGFRSGCETRTELIRPWLESHCGSSVHPTFSSCGVQEEDVPQDTE